MEFLLVVIASSAATKQSLLYEKKEIASPSARNDLCLKIPLLLPITKGEAQQYIAAKALYSPSLVREGE